MLVAVRASPGAARLIAISLIARLPLAVLSIALLVHVQRVTGSFAAAGLATGAYAVSLGVGGPLLGALADRRGQAAVLLASAGVAAALLVAVGALPAGTPVSALVAMSAGIGLSVPPVGACLRATLPSLVQGREKLRAVYALEASASELMFIVGPPLALAVAAVWSTGAALAAGGAILLAGTAAFVAQPASRRKPAARDVVRPRGGSLRAPAMRTLVSVMAAVGMVVGAIEVAVTAAAEVLHDTAAAAPLLGVWAVGSLAGGVLATRHGTRASGPTRLTALLAALAVGGLAMVPVAGSLLGMGLVLLFAGAAIAPTFAALHEMVDAATPASTVTEAFAWLTTSNAVGAAAGAAAGGAVAEHVGPAGAFALGALAGVAGCVTAAVRSHTLPADGSGGTRASYSVVPPPAVRGPVQGATGRCPPGTM
jgi:MFS family permease